MLLKFNLPTQLTVLLSAASLAAQAPAAVPEPAPQRAPVTVLDPITIIGTAGQARELPGSAIHFPAEEIRERDVTDINRILRQAPGVYVREEDGYGNFPNISLRGATTVRNSKVTVMEDGILAAPAPYSSPAAYYTPAVGRMSGLEVLKASSQVRYGPHITGGVLNYISTPIPEHRSTFFKGHYGSYDEVFAHLFHGNTVETGVGMIGYLVEGHLHRSDGFKTIDPAPGVDRDATGFTRLEPMIKLAWEPNTPKFHRIELKYGFTDFEADETYLGLTEADFRADPFRRYAATRFDHIDTTHHRSYLRHYFHPAVHVQVTTTAYLNHFERAWFKLNDVSLPGQPFRNLSEALAGRTFPEDPNGNLLLDVLRAEREGRLRYRNNQRSYYSYGIEQNYRIEFATAALEHELEAGARYHYDQEDRLQNDVVYTQDAAGRMIPTTIGAPGSQDSRLGESRALAVYVQDRIRHGKWSVTPGVRYESVWQDQENRLGTPSSREVSGRLDVIGGGLGIHYDLTDQVALFTSAYRGFSVPDPGGHLRSNLKPEHSIAVEAGLRYAHQRGLSAEAVFFHTQFTDLIVPSNAGGGGTLATENAGNVDVYGFELLGRYDPGLMHDWLVRTPLTLAFTYTDARFAGEAAAIGAGGSEVESVFSGARDGNRVPYIPEYQITAGAGLEYSRYGLYLTGTYVPWTYTTGSNTREQVRPDGTPDARFGTTDSYFIMDLTARAQITDWAKLFAGVRNLADREYVTSRIPHGPRPGAPRLVYAGVEASF